MVAFASDYTPAQTRSPEKKRAEDFFWPTPDRADVDRLASETASGKNEWFATTECRAPSIAQGETVKAATVDELRTVNTDTLQEMDAVTGGEYGFYSEEAVDLLLGTAVQESGGLKWRVQLGGGPARGLFQMEEATFNEIWDNYLSYRPELRGAMEAMLHRAGEGLKFEHIVNKVHLTAAMARLHYYRQPGAIPTTLQGQTGYWKAHYKTSQGRGTIGAYIENRNRYVGGGN